MTGKLELESRPRNLDKGLDDYNLRSQEPAVVMLPLGPGAGMHLILLRGRGRRRRSRRSRRKKRRRRRIVV